jgi:hypothetical protein
MEESPIVSTKISYKLINDDTFESDIFVYNYNPTSYALQTSEHFGKAFKEKLKEIGAIYKPSLTKFPHKGWVMSRGKYETFRDLINRIYAGEYKGDIPIEYKKKGPAFTAMDGPLGPAPQVPPMVSAFKQLFENLTLTVDTDKNIYMDGSKTYVWGTTEKVDNLIKELNIRPLTVMVTMGHKIIMANKN